MAAHRFASCTAFALSALVAACAPTSPPAAAATPAAGAAPVTGAPSPAASTAPTNGAIIASDMQFLGKRLHLLTTGPKDAPVAVLLLHGMAFKAQDWADLGTLAVLAGAGHRAVALDLPGFGASEPDDIAPEALLEQLLPALRDTLGSSRPVLVVPSMSGGYAIPYLLAHEAQVAGFVALAPVGVVEHEAALHALTLPTLIVWGSADKVIPVAQADTLAAAIAGSRKLVLAGASHPAYRDQPEAFHEALLEFLAALPH